MTYSCIDISRLDGGLRVNGAVQAPANPPKKEVPYATF